MGIHREPYFRYNAPKPSLRKYWVSIGVLSVLLFSVALTSSLVQERQNVRSQASGSLGTTTGSITISTSPSSITIFANYTGDSNGNSSAILEWKKTSDQSWRKVAMTAQPANTTNNKQWGASVYNLLPSTSYDVKITFSDPDGVSGTNPISSSVITAR